MRKLTSLVLWFAFVLLGGHPGKVESQFFHSFHSPRFLSYSGPARFHWVGLRSWSDCIYGLLPKGIEGSYASSEHLLCDEYL
jgi:hypothetical protein